jgi:hypothetical protein
MLIAAQRAPWTPFKSNNSRSAMLDAPWVSVTQAMRADSLTTHPTEFSHNLGQKLTSSAALNHRCPLLFAQHE